MGYCFSEARSAGGVSSSPNPWSRSRASLKTPPKGAGEKVLFDLANIIRDWPREKTVTLSDEDRHLRFILAVAGYPEIDVATRPLDWPLHAKSVEAMEVSKILDDVIGMHESTSLRSSLLNRDLNYRNEKLDELQSVHHDCLLLLFERTRKLDQFEEGEPKENGDDRYVPYFRPGEEALLTHLHSNDNRRREWWPKLQKLEDYKNVIPRKMTKPEKDWRGNPKFGTTGFEQWRKEKHEPWKAKKKLWGQFQNKEKYGRFSLQERELQEVAFQFHHVQSWMDKVVPMDSELEGTVQRFLRGASLMLELVISEVRQRIAHKVGIGSVTVDGGGRIVFLCPEDKIEERKILEKLESVSKEFLGVDRAVSRARNNVRFEETIRNWGKAGMNLGKKLDEISKADLLEAKKNDYKEWFGQIQSKLTPISIPKLSAHEDPPNSIKEVVGLLEKFPSPRIIVNDKSEDDCWFCNGSFFDDCADGAERKAKANQIDSLMGLEGKGEPSKNICQFHRLLYFIGHDQRLRDSTLRPPTDSDEISHKDDGSQRMVTAIARMDGNSLGILFRVDSEEENVPLDILVDRKRRRSFRFNSFWWQSLQRSVDEFGTGDRVAAWVTAGDDVILAQYDAVVRQTGKLPTVYQGREDDLLEKTLGGLVKELAQWKDLEGDELFLSIGAGLAIKRAKSNSGENDRIRSQLHRSKHLEHLAKNRWKTRAQDKWPEMLKKPHGEKVEFDDDEGATEDWIHTYSTMVVDRKDLDLGEKKKGEDLEDFVEEDFISWTPELVTEIIEHYGLEKVPIRVYGVLKRHYIEMEGGRGRLIVLPPKKRGM